MQHGWNSTSHQVLDPGIRHWFSARQDALVGYVEVAGRRVVAGAPVADERRLGAVAQEFEVASLARGREVCYFGAEHRLLARARHRRYAKHLIGLQPAWQAGSWGPRFDACASLRAQRNRALNKGVVVKQAAAARERDADLRVCHDAWLAGKGLPQLRFVAHSDPGTPGAAGAEPDILDDRRLFVASLAGRTVGYLSAAPVPRRRGWLVEKIVRRPDAPNGTAELLVDTALRTLASGAERFTLGLAPWAPRGEDSQQTLGADDDPSWLGLARRVALKRGCKLYDFAGLYSFKRKFRPEEWEPVYLLSTEERLTPRTFVALAGALLGGYGDGSGPGGREPTLSAGGGRYPRRRR